VTAAAVFGEGCGFAHEPMVREAQMRVVAPTREKVLGIGVEYFGAKEGETVEVAEAAPPLLAFRVVKQPGMRAARWAALGILPIVLYACSTSNARDQRYGQDAGADFDAPLGTGGTAGAGGAAGDEAGGAAGDGSTDSGGAGGTDTGGAAGGAGLSGAAGAGGQAGGGGQAGSSAGGMGGGITAETDRSDRSMRTSLANRTGLPCLAFVKHWTPAAQTPKMHHKQMSWTMTIDTRASGRSSRRLRSQPMES